MAEQNANAVAITGGTISGVTIPASNITGTLGVTNGGTGASTLTGYVKGTGTTPMTAAATIPNTDITGLGTASTKDAGAALGVATLDAGGKVPVSELPAAVLGALSYQGTWDASTNTPTLTSSVGSKGYYYVVSVAGNTNLNGITDWLVGDWAVFNGSIWQKVDNTETVTSVNGQTGAVVLTTTNIAEGTNLYYTDVRARAAISAGTGISYNNTTGVVTNAAPDQTVSITGAGTSVVTGTYPNFTVTSNDAFVGTVTSVAATAGTGISVTGSPITTSGTLNITNTAPDQTVVLTAGTGISTSGTYPNFTITNTSPSLGGDVVGPASATDNAVARYDTTTGKLIQNSLVIIDDTGSVTGVNALTAESLTVNNNATFGTSNSDTINFVGRINSDFDPATDNTYDLGRVGHEWRDLYIDGTANIDSLVADTADINGGTIDGTAIGATTPSTGAFTTVAAAGAILNTLGGGGNGFAARFNASNPRAGLFTLGTAGTTLLGNNLTFSSANVFNHDVTGTAWAAGDIGTGTFDVFVKASGTAGTTAFDFATTANRITSVSTTGLAVTGALSSTGALAIGNTVATAVAVASTHKVTIVIGGVTYYLLATNV
jgi:hypothetical protein